MGLLCSESAARAAEPEGVGPLTPPVQLRHDTTVDLTATAALAAAVVTTAVVQDQLQPGECRWCDGAPAELNPVDDAFRSALRRPDTQPANLTSHVLAYGLSPVAMIGLTALSSYADRRGDGMFVDLTITAQGALSAVLVSELLKPLIVRERPYVHAIVDPEARQEALQNPDALRSFPSGHTAAVFGMVSAAGMVATMRGYRLAPLVWGVGLMLGVMTGYARIAADKHYFTDTVGGAAVGFLVGGGVPLVFHRPKDAPRSAVTRWLENVSVSTRPVEGGRVVGVSWAL